MPKSFFLCHSSNDKGFARRLASDLKARGLRIWIDEGEIQVGDSLIGRIETAIDKVDYLAVILSKISVQSEWVLRELRMALHREIGGQAVVVLPLLYEDCKVPGFLRDKVYIDFRNPTNYQGGVLQIVERAQADLHSDLEDLRFSRLINEQQFTKVWQQALTTGIFSERFFGLCIEVLSSMKGGTKTWNPVVAASYHMFVMEVFYQKSVSKAVWSLLCRLIEHQEINGFLRYWTLDRIALAAGSEFVNPREWGIPNIIEYRSARGEGGDLFDMCLDMFFDPTKYHNVTTDRAGPVRILGFLWRYCNPECRARMLTRMKGNMEQSIPNSSHLLDGFATLLPETEGLEIEASLTNIRKNWANIGAGNVEGDRRRAELALEHLLTEDYEVARGVIMDLFHIEAARVPRNRHDFELSMTLAQAFAPPYLKTIRERHGGAQLYKFLSLIIVDGRVNPEFSILALESLVSEFGVEGLLLEDQLPGAVFDSRGQPPDVYCLADILCEMINSADPGDTSGAFLMLALHTTFDAGGRVRLRAIANQHVSESERMKAVVDLLDGRISPEKAQRILTKT